MTTTRRVSLNGDGDLVWYGHDVGPEVGARRPGSSEYEFWRTVRVAHLPALRVALGGPADADLAGLVMARFDSDVALAAFAAEIDVPTEFSSWTSFDDD